MNANVVDVYVGYLRTKIARLGLAGVSIQAVRGVGFRLAVEPEAGPAGGGPPPGDEGAGPR